MITRRALKSAGAVRGPRFTSAGGHYEVAAGVGERDDVRLGSSVPTAERVRAHRESRQACSMDAGLTWTFLSRRDVEAQQLPRQNGSQ